MKIPLFPAGSALVLALLMTGCESDGGVSTRKQEKSATYATLRPWQKTLVDAGVISKDFTPDMVYLALGTPDKVETKDFPEGRAEMWTYTHVFPSVDAIHGFRHANFTTESAYQPQPATTQVVKQLGNGDDVYANTLGAPTVPRGFDRGAGESLYKSGPAQGGTIEPSDLRSYTIKVLFASGKVVRFGANENVH